MGDQEPGVRRWTLRHFQPADTYDPDQGRAQGGVLLRRQIDAAGFVIDMDSLTASEPSPIVLDDAHDAGYAPYTGHPSGPDGFITEYTATATERHRDDIRSDPVPDQDNPDVVWADVPEENTAVGGGLRVTHKLGGPVTVTAYDRDGDRTGYLFAQELDDDEVHVELLRGAARLRITRDPDDEESGG